MRVLVVLPGVSPDGGAERSFVAMVPGLIDAGIRLHVAVFTERQQLVAGLEDRGVVIHDLSSVRGVPRRAARLRDVIRSIRPDVVHSSLHEANVPAQLAARMTGTPALVSWANTDYGAARASEPGAPVAKLRLLQLYDALLARLAHSSFHAVTPAVAELNAAALRVEANRVHVGRRGREPETFDFRPPDPAGEPSRGVAGDEEIVLAVGRQDRQKGYETLLTEFDRLAEHRACVRLWIVGREGSASAGIARTMVGMRHRNRVELLGQRSDVADLMHRAEVLVCSSWREGAAGAIIEAMACGLPVVSVPLEGASDMLADRQNALVVPRHELGDAIGEVLDDPELAANLAHAARRTFEQHYTLEAATQRMVEIYRRMAAA